MSALAGRNVGYACILVAVSALFLVSLPARFPWLGQTALEFRCSSDLLSPVAIRIVGEWLHPPPKASRGWPTYETPIITGNLHVKDTVTCYSPLVFMPLYLTAELTGKPPTMNWTSYWCLFAHYWATLLAGVLVYSAVLSLGTGIISALVFSLASVLLMLFLPGPMYFFTAVYWADMLVIPLFVLMVLLEAQRDMVLEQHLRLRRIDRLQAVLFYLGFLTDWFYGSLFVAILLKRIWLRQLPERWPSWLREITRLCLPMVLALATFLVHLGFFVNPLYLGFKFLFHTGIVYDISGLSVSLYSPFWSQYIVHCLGAPAPLVLWFTLIVVLGAAIAFRLGRQRCPRGPLDGQSRMLGIMLILLGSCLVHTYLFRAHAAENNYSALKFVVPFSCASFALLPAAFAASISPAARLRTRSMIVAGIVLILGLVYVYANRDGFKMYYGTTSPSLERLGRAAAQGLRDTDILVGPRLYQGTNGKQVSDLIDDRLLLGQFLNLAAFCGRIISPFDDSQFRAFARLPMSKGMDISVVIIVPEPPTPREQALVPYAKEVWRSENLMLMRIDIARYLSLFPSDNSKAGDTEDADQARGH